MIFSRSSEIRISKRYVVLFMSVSLLGIGLLALILHLSAVQAQRNQLDLSLAEPHQDQDGVISFPFGKQTPANISCPRNAFRCDSSGKCISLYKRCDGTVDCPRAEDELNCVCAFRLPPAKFCDKYPDCFDESDESFCSYCPKGYFNCGDGKCIPRQKVCDSKVDCDNFMDENFCFKLSSNIALAGVDGTYPVDSTGTTRVPKTGFLLRNKNGVWYPVCANPMDNLQDILASFACVSITANPLASSTHQYKTIQHLNSRNFIYHNRGRFIQWNGCLTDKGIFVACDDVRCGFNPKHLLPRKPTGRIVGGERSEPGAWPWHAAIYKNGVYACGASLVTDRWLISAAHCFIGYKDCYYEIQLGMLRRRSFTPHQKTYRVDRVVLHPKFSVVTLEFDIAMIRVDEVVIFDFWVRPICLPTPKRVENSGSYCTAIGWGDTGETDDDSEDLQEVHVPLTKSCKRDPNKWLCAGFVEGGRDACQGDSGGPLMCLQEDGISWYIAGVISAGNGCARPNTPGMYTRVVHFLDWIKQVITSPNKVDLPLQSCPGLKCAAVGGGNCLQKDKVCDGHVDCYDALDEVNCARIQV